MTPTEREEFLSIARVCFASVNRLMVHGAENGEPDDIRLARLSRWGKTFADVDFETAKRCLDAMHRGETDHADKWQHLSQWADQFPAFVRRWCKHHRPLDTSGWRYQSDEDGPRYQCVECLDSGFVLVLNEAYLDEHWHAIDNNRLSPIDPHDRAQVEECRRWYLDARAWCRSKNAGPLEGAVLCDCAGRRSTIKRADNERLRMAVYDRKRMPRLEGSGHLFARETAERFIDNNSDAANPSARYEWDAYA
jgi:hypothetical protein